MHKNLMQNKAKVNCRVGSLENIGEIEGVEYPVNCRVGSLEIFFA